MQSLQASKFLSACALSYLYHYLHKAFLLNPRGLCIQMKHFYCYALFFILCENQSQWDKGPPHPPPCSPLFSHCKQEAFVRSPSTFFSLTRPPLTRADRSPQAHKDTGDAWQMSEGSGYRCSLAVPGESKRWQLEDGQEVNCLYLTVVSYRYIYLVIHGGGGGPKGLNTLPFLAVAWWWWLHCCWVLGRSL